MLTPEYLQGMPDELVGIFEELEGDIIKDICRRIEKTAMITDTAEYEMLRLRELGAGEKYIEGLMKKTLNASDDEVERMVFDAAQVSDEFYKKAYAAKGKGFTPYEYNDFTGQLVTAAVNQTQGELKNLTRSAGFAYDRHFNGVRKTYADTLDYAHMQVSTGATDYITAVRNATKKLTDSGLQFVDYESGVRNHCDVAVRRAVLTGVSQMAGEIAAHNMRELDTDIVEVSAHACARPEHALWQGRLYSYSGRDRRYPSLVAVTGYGTVTGLMGANCRHTFYPFIPGVSQRNYTEDELRSIDPPPFEYEGRTYTAYEASQKQRQIEREIRKTKREIIAAEATGDKDRLTVKAVRLRRQKELYHDFSKAAGLREQKERMQVNGYDRSKSMKTVWAEKKAEVTNMSAPSNDWSRAVPIPHTAEEMKAMTEYARQYGVQIYNPRKFDGDLDVLRVQIDTIEKIKEEFGLRQKITISFTEMDDDDFAETVNNSITFNLKALRNREVTIQNLRADHMLSARDPSGIAAHEMGHIISRKYGKNGLDIAKQSYYNIYNKHLENDEMIIYLKENVSGYCGRGYRYAHKIVFEEITPEILSMHYSGESSAFSTEFVHLLKEGTNV